MSNYIWIDERDVLEYHNQALRLFGGLEGVRDSAGLKSALARPLNLLAYSEKQPSVFRLAAAYGYGLARSHPFVDGNKRTALIVAVTFLEANGFEVVGAREEEYFVFVGVAEGKVSEAELAKWFKASSKRL